MRRLLLTLAVLLTFPAAANAAVVSTVNNGTLAVDGDAAADRLTLRATADAIQLDLGSDGTVDDAFERVPITRIVVRTGGGGDNVRVAFATTVPTAIEAGAGDDVVTGGAGAETVVAGDGSDLVHAGGGEDSLFLGAGDDTAVHADGRLTLEGQTGTDTLRELGTDEAEELTVQAFNGRALFVRDLGPRADTAGIELAEINTAGSADFIDVGDLSGTSVTRLDADLGHADAARDGLTVAGSNAIDNVVVGDVGEATRITGLPVEVRVENADDVTVQARGGNDRLTATTVRPGLVLDGNDGIDRMAVPSSAADQSHDVQPAGGRVRLNKLLFDAEVLELFVGAGSDSLSVGDVSGTGLEDIITELGGTDLKPDTLTVTGTAASDEIRVEGVGSFHEIEGLPARLSVFGADPGDRLVIFGRDGDDTIDASNMGKDQFQPFLEGGPGKDVIVGSPGQDRITGGSGTDVAFMGAGLDTFTWGAGDGRDIVEGQAGTDFLQMNGTGLGEAFVVTPAGSRTRVLRDADDVDMGDVERVSILAGAGTDTVRVEDMSGTDTNHVELELAPSRGTTATDQAEDRVTVNGTFGNDSIAVTGAGHQVALSGLAARVFINRSDKGDTLHVDSKPGGDVISVAPSARNLMTVTTA
jgi:Ca2+-binding RTX toxin-like protein